MRYTATIKMPSIQGECTFTELCQKLEVSAPWVKKVQRLFRLPEAHGTKGVRTFYNDHQVQFLRNIRMLRAADVDFQELKVLDDLELWLLANRKTEYPIESGRTPFTVPLLLRSWESVDQLSPSRMDYFPGSFVYKFHRPNGTIETFGGIALEGKLDQQMAEYYWNASNLRARLSKRVRELAKIEEQVSAARKRWAEWLGDGVDYGEGKES